MWIRLLGVFILLMLGIWTTIGSATSAPSEAPLAQATTAVPTNTLPVPTTAVPTNTPQPTATLMPSPTGTATLIPTATQSGLVDLTISKVGSADPVNTGDQLTYTITVFNSSTFSGGTAPATTVIDSVPSGTVLVSTPSGGGGCSNSGTSAGSIITCNVPALGPNQSIAFTLIVQVIAGSGTVITNSATVDPNNNVQEINESNNTATLNTTVGLTPVPTSTVAPAASATAVTAGTPITVIETAIPGPTPRAEGTTLWFRSCSRRRSTR